MRNVTMALLVLAYAVSTLGGVAKVQKHGKVLPGSYLVILDDQTRREPRFVHSIADDVKRIHGATVGYVWDAAINGFTIRGTEEQAFAISRDPRVSFVEQDSEIEVAATQQTNIDPVTGTQGTTNYFWNLDRVDQRPLPLDNIHYYCRTGFGVKAYVIDTGILRTHQEFWRSSTDHTSRVESGVSFVSDGAGGQVEILPDPGSQIDTGTNPCRSMQTPSDSYLGGHGTAVASALGGRLAGTAHEVTLVPVKVIPCNGPGRLSDLVAGVNWVAQQAQSDPPSTNIRRVVNMSIFHLLPENNPDYNGTEDPYGLDITGDQLSSLETAIQGLIGTGTYGIIVVAAAGNQNIDSRGLTPARLAYGNTSIVGGHVITAGASMILNGLDKRWVSANPIWQPFVYQPNYNTDPASNWGPAVDIFAPADNVTVAHILSTNAYRTTGRSGTSFAAPLVAGVAAGLVQIENGLTAVDVWTRIRDDATVGALDSGSLNSAPNRLLYRQGLSLCRTRP